MGLNGVLEDEPTVVAFVQQTSIHQVSRVGQGPTEERHIPLTDVGREEGAKAN